jgi:lambda family phage portal protein
MFEAIKKSIARFIYRSVSYSVRNAYEAGSTGRRLGRWNPISSGPNASVIADLERLRARSRDLVRNNPWISRGVNSWVANEIGCDITFKSAAPDEAFRTAADELWERQCAHFDADGMQHFSGMLAQIVRTRRDAGEIFVRRRQRNLSDGLPVPVQYQLLEPEFCPVWYSESNPTRRIHAGIEFNLIGKRTAYWMYRAHPGDGIFFTDARQQELVAVPASQVLHHFKQLRPGQIRGVPAIVQAMIRAKDFDEYDDAELVRKKNRAAFTGAIQRPNYNPDVDDKFDPLTGEPIDKTTPACRSPTSRRAHFSQRSPARR